MSTFLYSSIDPDTETRLLIFKAGDGSRNCPITCSLVHTSLESPIAFEALSYVWGHSVIGFMNNADPDEEVYGWNMTMVAPPERFIKARYRDLVDHPEQKWVMFSNGYPRPKGRIVIDGIEVEVGGELYSALKRLRALWQPSEQDEKKGKNGIAVWIDAICINQNDIAERNRHVLRMGEIYSKAKAVRIWLGEVVSDADRRAFESMGDLSDCLDATFEDGEDPDRLRFRQRLMSHPKMQNIQWNCLGALLKRTWFRRTWVIQEIANASKAVVHLGGYGYSWEALSGVVLTLRHLDMDHYLWAYTEFTADMTLGLMADLHRRKPGLDAPTDVQNSEHRFTLLDLLHRSRNFTCTLLHDKIYGVLGLACDADQFSAPDYSRSAPDIFQDFAMTHILKSDNLGLLYHCGKGRGGSELTLPSWVPDWTQQQYHEPFYLSALKCAASSSSTPFIQFSPNGKMLTTRGRIFETIGIVDSVRKIPRNSHQSPKPVCTFPDLETGKDLPVYHGPDMDTRSQDGWIREFQGNVKNWVINVLTIAFPDGACDGKTFEDLWRTFVCDQTIGGEAPPKEWGEHFSRFVTNVTRPDMDVVDRMEEMWQSEVAVSQGGKTLDHGGWDLTERFDMVEAPGNENYWEFVKANGSWCYNRRFFKTEAGRFGWGPDGVQSGDVVMVLDGLDVPLLLRPMERGYTVVGDCYAHGLMKGQAMELQVVSKEIYLV